jgi:hypothetical protein
MEYKGLLWAPGMFPYVRYWHKADIACIASMSAFGGKAGIFGPEGQCLLMTQSGHPLL